MPQLSSLICLAGKESLRIIEGFDLLQACCLPLIEVLQHKVAIRMHVTVVLNKVLKALLGALLLSLRLNFFFGGLGNGVRLGLNGIVERLDGVGGVLDKLFVGLLGFLLPFNCVALHSLGVFDDL